MNSIKDQNCGFVAWPKAETCRPEFLRGKMKSSLLKLSLLAFIISLAGCASNTTKTSETSEKPVASVDVGPQTELKGRIVFDVPPEQMYKLGRDHIRIVSEDEMRRFIKQAEMNSFPDPGGFNVRELAKIKVEEEVTTDEDGNFSHTLPAKGRVGLVVEVKRRHKGEDGPSPKYFWIVWVTLENRTVVNVNLNSADCLPWHPLFETSNIKYIKSI